MLILTEPIFHKSFLSLRCILKRIYKWIRSKIFDSSRVWKGMIIGGHYGVTRSLLNGLKINDIKHEYNTVILNKNFSYKDAIILSGLDTLKSAIELKKAGKIGRIFAGPNLIIFANEIPFELLKDIDFLIVPCDFVKKSYIQDLGSKWSKKIIIWPAGVDLDDWNPSRINKDPKKILIYSKQAKGNTDDVEQYIQVIKAKGYKVELIEYGNYKLEDYKDLLSQVEIMVGFVRDESQGLAWAEAWASDVYTLIWRNETQTLKGRKYKCETAPYLDNENGIYFDNVKDFERRFESFIVDSQNASPRRFVEKSMSDEVCARNLLNLIENSVI